MKQVVAISVSMYTSLVVASLLFTGQSSAIIDEQSVAGYWLLDEGPGEVVEDSCENGNDGSIVVKHRASGIQYQERKM